MLCIRLEPDEIEQLRLEPELNGEGEVANFA